MGDQIMEIEALRRRALELLRRHDSFMPVGAIALALGVPLYAADCALDAARRVGEVTFEGGAGWKALPPAAPALPDDEQRFQPELRWGA